ncbi:MAG: threonine aldolase family protein [Cognatishimia sp.]|uniref:threonine aldolase family protein n=1 Tax=Cognatishimia sp. TaxID=2211648 RepID=UPI0040590C95
MFFASDNAGPVHPQVMEALANANAGYAGGYGNDPLTAEVQAQIRTVFEAPEAVVHFVPTGTAANVLALATLANPWDTIYCARHAHIQMDECNAPEFYSGAKLTTVGHGDKLDPKNLRKRIAETGVLGVHGAQRGPVSITQVTEFGQIYTLTELAELTAVAKEFDCPVHLDGARFANALVALNCSPADMTWRLGVDAVSFGGTKNGCMGVEAVVIFDPQKAWEFELRRKRGAHLFSKLRYLSAQMQGYLANDLWLQTARTANDNCARLTAGLRAAGVTFDYEPQANMIFCPMTRGTHRRLHDAGAMYYLLAGDLEGPDDELLPARLVCDWSITHELIDQFIDIVQG